MRGLFIVSASSSRSCPWGTCPFQRSGPLHAVSPNPGSVFPLRGVLPGGRLAGSAATFTGTFPLPPPSHAGANHLRTGLSIPSDKGRVFVSLCSALRAGPGVEQMPGEDARRRHRHLAGARRWGTGDR
uniref:Uncharacterized protein n=1 Tax=Rousettus aegyptiacus TaxID=9407 RepID=A0A7J8CHM4_ROUAE|nr:hypothetical protein HJG63_008964 [Rousettus aegyptiacus]